jgi:S-adenosylmethionine uptake transporter
MVLGCGFFTVNDACMKLAVSHIPVSQAIFLRGALVCIPLLIIWGPHVGTGISRKMPLKQQVLCAGLLAVSVLLFVSSLSFLALSIAVTAIYTGPLFVVLLAPIMLNESLTRQKIIVVIVGFSGAFLVVAPTFQDLSWPVLLPVTGALVTAWRDIELRRLTPKASTFSILAFTQVFITLIFLAPAVVNWSPFGLSVVLLLFGASTGFAVGVYLTVDALRNQEASLVVPFKYSGVVWSGIIGLMIWGAVPVFHQFVGAALVIVSGIYLHLRTRVPAQLASPLDTVG